jgi:glycosyltransferase involved in cell wall biosynthesis
VRERLRQDLLVRVLSRWSRAVVAVSEALRQAWLADGRLDPRLLRVVHNGVDVAAFEPRPQDRAAARRRLGWAEDEAGIVTVAVLRPGKGIDVLLAALARRDVRARLLVVGDGPLRGELAAAAGGLGLSHRVHFVGHRDDVPLWLAAGDVFAHPSLEDAFPTVLLEAMAAGLAVVASRVGGVPEIVADGVTGLLVRAGDAEDLARALAEVLARPEERRAMGEAGRTRARERFSTAAWVARLEAVYDEALVSRAGERG